MLDTSSRAIVVGFKSKPYLIKPNREKLFELTAIILDLNENYRSAILSAHKMGASTICLSLGSEGAIFSDGNNLIKGFPPDIKERNPVAAGDALLAGIVAGLVKGQTNTETIRFGVACGAAAASLDGTNLGSKEMVEKLSEYVSITVQ